MIFELLLVAFLEPIRWIVALLPDMPPLSPEIAQVIGFFREFTIDAVRVVQYMIGPKFFHNIFILGFAVFGFEVALVTIIFIGKKIPFLSMT